MSADDITAVRTFHGDWLVTYGNQALHVSHTVLQTLYGTDDRWRTEGVPEHVWRARAIKVAKDAWRIK